MDSIKINYIKFNSNNIKPLCVKEYAALKIVEASQLQFIEPSHDFIKKRQEKARNGLKAMMRT